MVGVIIKVTCTCGDITVDFLSYWFIPKCTWTKYTAEDNWKKTHRCLHFKSSTFFEGSNLSLTSRKKTTLWHLIFSWTPLIDTWISGLENSLVPFVITSYLPHSCSIINGAIRAPNIVFVFREKNVLISKHSFGSLESHVSHCKLITRQWSFSYIPIFTGWSSRL